MRHTPLSIELHREDQFPPWSLLLEDMMMGRMGERQIRRRSAPLWGSSRDSYQYAPLVVGADAVADDLGALEVGCAIKHFDRVRGGLHAKSDDMAQWFEWSIQILWFWGDRSTMST